MRSTPVELGCRHRVPVVADRTARRRVRLPSRSQWPPAKERLCLFGAIRRARLQWTIGPPARRDGRNRRHRQHVPLMMECAGELAWTSVVTGHRGRTWEPLGHHDDAGGHEASSNARPTRRATTRRDWRATLALLPDEMPVTWKSRPKIRLQPDYGHSRMQIVGEALCAGL